MLNIRQSRRFEKSMITREYDGRQLDVTLKQSIIIQLCVLMLR